MDQFRAMISLILFGQKLMIEMFQNTVYQLYIHNWVVVGDQFCCHFFWDGDGEVSIMGLNIFFFPFDLRIFLRWVSIYGNTSYALLWKHPEKGLQSRWQLDTPAAITRIVAIR